VLQSHVLKSIRLIAALQLTLISPAILFLAAVLVGAGGPPQHDLAFAFAAQAIVSWYAARMWTLWLLLLVLPLAALAAGFIALPRSWNDDGTFFVAGTTFTSVGILAVVVLHMLAN
jgi:hypothetical protein